MSTSHRVARTSRTSAGIVALGAMGGLVFASRAFSRLRRGSFRGQSVVITGGARGLGLALAQRFAAEGARLSLIARHADQLAHARHDFALRGVEVGTFVCDIRDPAQVNETVASILSLSGGIDVLVNNAGIIQMSPFDHASEADFDESLRTHFWGPLYLIRATLPHMRSRGGGRILNISSIGGRIAVPHLIPYSVGKFALVALSEGLRAELARDGIVVTTAAPGLMRTGSHRNVIVRGRHRQEARWFGLGAATSLTSMRVDRAARQIVDACRAGRAEVMPGIQARLAWRLHRGFPELTTALMAAASAWLLPAPSRAPGAGKARLSRDLNLGWVSDVLPTRAARQYNQPVAADERS